MDNKPFGGKLLDILQRNKSIDPEVLIKADEETRASGVRLESYLVEKNLVPSTEMILALSEYLNMAPINLAHFTPDTHLVELIPRETLNHCQLVPIAKTGKNLTVALSDPFDIMAIDKIHTLTGLDIIPLIASEKDVKDILARSFAVEANTLDMKDIMKESENDVEVGAQGQQDDGDKQTLEEMMETAQDAPVIRMVNMILIEAIKMKTADICIEPQEDCVRLRYKIDGSMVERPNLQKNLQSAIISRIKIMSDIDIGEQRIPQDGRFRIQALGKKLDMRVSVLPTIFGGRVVMRILDKGALFPNLSGLGLEEHADKAMSYAISQPHGIILVTGPTGSGKTTTLYSCLQELNKPDVNIVTCEDPVEYQLPRVNQVRIHTEVGLTFSSALRAILRQDPDIILIGEIRDSETCEIAVKAALTGHLVLSTLHANESAGAITRLLDMGVEPFLMASSLILAQAQRLCKKLCPACKKETSLNLKLCEEHKIDPALFKEVKIYGPGGCPKCHGIGYKGRTAIMEVLPVDENIRLLILKQAITDELRQKAQEQGMITLRDSALLKVKEGTTSLDAAVKITTVD
ncbi:MAG: ATPase, T2SS/T4P/T4SS family [Kiritimatiellae bacterium]|nr:ATPase, T2SS/T4P/T4SS family [Kiritimatiellia bacterium]MDD5522827.1 ATPase, T2SS/T4P/T4SS family [Kiritimatiellia bacterium]